MICDCIDRITKDTFDKLPANNPKYSNLKIKAVCFDGLGWADSGEEILSIPVTVLHEPIGRKEETKIHFLAQYCTFCGKALSEEEGANG